MFIFSQLNFLDPKPRVSEGDWRVPGEVGGSSSCCPEAELQQGGDLPEEARRGSVKRKGALGPEWNEGSVATTDSV